MTSTRSPRVAPKKAAQGYLKCICDADLATTRDVSRARTRTPPSQAVLQERRAHGESHTRMFAHTYSSTFPGKVRVWICTRGSHTGSRALPEALRAAPRAESRANAAVDARTALRGAPRKAFRSSSAAVNWIEPPCCLPTHGERPARLQPPGPPAGGPSISPERCQVSRRLPPLCAKSCRSAAEGCG